LIELRTHDGVPRGGIASEWELLLDEDPHASLFQGPRFLGLWHDVLGQRTTARVHTVKRDGRLIGVIPEGHVREGSATGPVEVRRFLGGTEVTDYLGPVSRVEDRADVAFAYLELLAAEVDWDELIAGGLAADSGWPEVLRSAAASHGLEVVQDDVEDVCPRIDLTGGYEGYLESLAGRQRQELNRKMRKLVRDAGEIDVVGVDSREIAGHLDAFLDRAAESEPDKAGFFSRPEMHEWFKALAEGFAGDGVFRLHRLDVGGIPAASTLSLVHRGVWGLYNSSFDPTLAALAPGIVLTARLVGIAADEGCGVFDLRRGAEPYKHRLGAVDRPLRRLEVVRR